MGVDVWKNPGVFLCVSNLIMRHILSLLNQKGLLTILRICRTPDSLKECHN